MILSHIGKIEEFINFSLYKLVYEWHSRLIEIESFLIEEGHYKNNKFEFNDFAVWIENKNNSNFIFIDSQHIFRYCTKVTKDLNNIFVYKFYTSINEDKLMKEELIENLKETKIKEMNYEQILHELILQDYRQYSDNLNNNECVNRPDIDAILNNKCSSLFAYFPSVDYNAYLSGIDLTTIHDIDLWGYSIDHVIDKVKNIFNEKVKKVLQTDSTVDKEK